MLKQRIQMYNFLLQKCIQFELYRLLPEEVRKIKFNRFQRYLSHESNKNLISFDVLCNKNEGSNFKTSSRNHKGSILSQILTFYFEFIFCYKKIHTMYAKMEMQLIIFLSKLQSWN